MAPCNMESMSKLIMANKVVFAIICLYSMVMLLVVFPFIFQSEEELTLTPYGSINVKKRRFWLKGILGHHWVNLSVFDNTIDDYEIPRLSHAIDIIDDGDDETEENRMKQPQKESKVQGYFLLDSNETFNKRCGRCALVSSAGHLYRSGTGAEIDDADCVLRMNTAPVSGWTKDVGSRTDFRIIGHVNLPRGLVRRQTLREEILANETTRAEYIVVPWLERENVNMKSNRIIKQARNFKKAFPEVKFVFLTKKKHDESEARFKMETGITRKAMHTRFSTGFVSMMFALDVCQEVHVYGMSNPNFCKKYPKSKVPYHYYEPRKKTECFYIKKSELSLRTGHKFVTEHSIFARWSLVYNITFHHPAWTVTIQNAKSKMDTPFLRKYKAALKKKH